MKKNQDEWRHPKNAKKMRKIAKNKPNMAPRPAKREGDKNTAGLRDALSGP